MSHNWMFTPWYRVDKVEVVAILNEVEQRVFANLTSFVCIPFVGEVPLLVIGF